MTKKLEKQEGKKERPPVLKSALGNLAEATSTLLGAKKASNNVGSVLQKSSAKADDFCKSAGAETTVREAKTSSAKNGESHSSSSDATKTITELPDWLRKRSASLRYEREKEARDISSAGSRPIGLALDKQTRAILDTFPKLDPSVTSKERYRAAHAVLLKTQHTPLDHANTRSHYDSLRTAWRWCEIMEIENLRRASDKARKRGDHASAEQYTRSAFERACALEWQSFSERWGKKVITLAEQGQRPTKRSKRFGPIAPTVDATAINIGRNKRHGKRYARHELRLLTLAAFGIRPSELKKKEGIRLTVEAKGNKVFVVAKVYGAKFDTNRGHYIRLCAREVPATGGLGFALRYLADTVKRAGPQGLTLHTTDADHRSLNHLLRGYHTGLSAYSFRHGVGSALKAEIAAGRLEPVEASAFMGHRSTASLLPYGRGRRGADKGFKIKAKVDDMFAPRIKAHKRFKSKQEASCYPPQPTTYMRRPTRTPRFQP